MRISAILAVLVLGLAACTLPGATIDDGPGLTGTYVVNGIDPTGTEYSGTVVITATADSDRVAIEWIVTGAVQVGEGTITGDVLDVTWNTVSGSRPDAAGTARYEILADGGLVGTRTITGIDTPGTEEIFPES